MQGLIADARAPAYGKLHYKRSCTNYRYADYNIQTSIRGYKIQRAHMSVRPASRFVNPEWPTKGVIYAGITWVAEIQQDQ